MKKHLLTLHFLIFFLVSLYAQKEGSIKGTVQDTASGMPLANATVTILLASDSSLISFTRTGTSGFFIVRNIGNGKYRLLVTHEGYRNINRQFVITGELTTIDWGVLAITSRITLLQEVTIVQEKPPVVIRNDTIEFNAGSFKTRPNAVAEDLLKKLPGIQVDKDGKIKSNGQEIKRILVDGKEFFGSDPKMASKNLPADAIDKVQVFNRKSDQSRFTGFDDGNSEKTINLTIKPGKKTGVFGKATAGTGDKGRYEGSFNVNSFSGERQLSAIGMMNNTNKQGFSFLDILNFTGSLPGAGARSGGNTSADINSTGLPISGAGNNEGITATWAGGVNYNNTWQKKMDVMTSYFYNLQQTNILENLRQQWIVPGSNFNTTKNNNTSNTNENHRVNITGDYKIDSVNSIRLVSTGNTQQSKYHAYSSYNSATASGEKLNKGYASSFITGRGYSWNNNALFRHRFAKKGRTYSTSLTFNTNYITSNGGLLSQNNYFLQAAGSQQDDTINQLNSQHNNGNTYGVVASYTEPLSKKSLLEFNYAFNTAHSIADRITADFDKASGKYTTVNESLSNNFLNNYTFHKPGIHWRYQQKKYNFAIGAAVQQASLKSSFHIAAKDSSIYRSFVNFLPTANLQYSINQYKNIRIAYTTFTRQPSVTQLQPLADNADPLNIQIGNPGLQQEYYQQLQADYISFDPYRHTSFFAALTTSVIGNKIVNADRLSVTGQRISQPVNANGIYNMSMYTAWGFPLKKIKSKLNLNSSFMQSHNVGFINAEKNNITTWNASQEITWNYSYKELFDAGAGAEIGYTGTRYSLQRQQNIHYWNQHYTFDVTVYLSGGFSIASDVDYTTRSGLAQGYNLTAALWNAGIAKQIFKNKKGELRLQVYDILNQNIGISRSSNQNYIEDKSYNVLRRYVQCSFTYNISRFAGKNIAAPSKRNSNIQVIRAKG